MTFNVSRSNKQILQTIFQSVLYIIYFLNFNFHFVCLICLQATEGNQGLTNFFVYINYLQTCIRFFLATSSYKCLQNNPVVHVPCKNTTRKILWIFLQIISKSTFNYKKEEMLVTCTLLGFSYRHEVLKSVYVDELFLPLFVNVNYSLIWLFLLSVRKKINASQNGWSF